jgi:hypothetical protein
MQHRQQHMLAADVPISEAVGLGTRRQDQIQRRLRDNAGLFCEKRP